MADVEFMSEKVFPELKKLRSENDELRRKLEYAYRCVENGFIYGTFNFTVLRRDASNFLSELDGDNP